MNYFRNAIPKLFDAVPAPMASTQDILAERMQSVRETASLLYNRMMNNTEWKREIKH